VTSPGEREDVGVAGTLRAGDATSKAPLGDAEAAAPSKPSAPIDEPTTVAGRLEAERAGRSHDEPEVEDALAAFSAAGLEVKELRQGVARTSHARYCQYGTSPGGHRVLVCEFADAAEAERGAAYMRTQLVDPRRRVEPHGRLAVTVFLTEKTPEADRESQRYFETLAAIQLPTSPARSADQ